MQGVGPLLLLVLVLVIGFWGDSCMHEPPFHVLHLLAMLARMLCMPCWLPAFPWQQCTLDACIKSASEDLPRLSKTHACDTTPSPLTDPLLLYRSLTPPSTRSLH